MNGSAMIPTQRQGGVDKLPKERLRLQAGMAGDLTLLFRRAFAFDDILEG